MKFLYLLLPIVIFYTAQAQLPPATAVAPEDAAFNAWYQSNKAPVVTGKLLNATAEELKSLAISCTLVTPFADMQQKKLVVVMPDGSFKIPLDYALPYQQIWFGIGDIFYAVLYANKGLYVELDIKKINAAKGVDFNGDGVRYLGEDGPLNAYLNNYILYKRPMQLQLSGELQRLPRSSGPVTDSLLKAYNTLYDSIKQIEDSYIAANPSPYGWLLENERMSDYYSGICTMYFNKVMGDDIWQKIKQHKSYVISNSGMGYYRYVSIYLNARPGTFIPTTWKDVATLPNLSPAETTIIDSLKAGERLKGQYLYTEENIKRWTKLLGPSIQLLALKKNLARQMRMFDSMFLPARADFLAFQLTGSHDVNEQKLQLAQILASMQTPWCKSVIENEYNLKLAKINEINKTLAGTKGDAALTGFGKPLIQTSFNAILFKTQSIKALDFLAKLKQSFPGKAIIIDRWATWCAPCLGEMPHSKELQQASAGMPVVFVYLCTLNGSSEDKWKSKVVELKQPGVHFLIDEALDDELSSYFSFSGYPGYALIDKSGQYKPGAIKWMSEIKDKDALFALVNN